MKKLYNISKNLKKFRDQYGYTLKDVASYLGITYQSYHAYERGLTVPTLQNFLKIAELYDVSLDDLVED